MLRSLALLAAAVLAAPLAAPVVAAATPAAARAATATAPELGYDRLVLRRAALWLQQPDLDGGPDGTSYPEETGGYVPVAGDTDGDGTGSLSLFRDGVWLIRDTPRGAARVLHFGQRGDVPLLGDWNGDGIATPGLFRRGHWYVRDAIAPSATRTFGFGLSTDQPVIGDWNGDGRTDIAVVRNRIWYERDSSTTGVANRSFAFGNIGDRRFAGDWDHDGRDSPGVFRGGTWYLRESSDPVAPYATAVFGRSGDSPLIVRTPGLAPGVRHRVLRDPSGPFTVHVATVDLAAASTPDAVLSGTRLAGVEPVSDMARRTGAALAINGDYFLSSGRPVHAFAADGRLLQTPQLLGRALGIDATGTRVAMGYPDTRAALTAQNATSTVTIGIPRWNSGRADGDTAAAYTSAGGDLEIPPDGDCYAGLTYTGGPIVHPDGGVETAVSVTGSRCGDGAPLVPGRSGLVLDGSRYNVSGDFLAALYVGQSAQLTTNLGFPGAVDVLGGNPVLLAGGVPQSQDLDGAGDFFDRQPRTAVGVTADGQLLLVVVDGRQPGYSVGMTLRELTDLMISLGARDAVNLDGGGSTTMWLNGQRVNRPSDGFERGVGSALVVLPGADPGQADLTLAPPSPVAASRPHVQHAPAAPLVSPVYGGEPVPGWVTAAADPGSIGGLADALARKGTPLPPDLQRAEVVYTGAR